MIYFITSSILFLAAYIVYVLVLKKLTFFKFNRAYLLGSLFFSIVSPLVSIPSSLVDRSSLYTLTLPALQVSDAATTSTTFGAIDWIFGIYALGVCLSMIVLLLSIYRVLAIRTKTNEVEDDGSYLSEGTHAFSFFKHIHIGQNIDSDTRSMIVSHEHVHVKQYHSLDILFYSLARVFFWFNPAVHLAMREVRLNHEYLADENTLNEFGTDYQYTLLNQALDTKVFALANTFKSESHLKNRIKMMNKQKSKHRSKLAYGLIIPLLVGGLWLNACTQHSDVSDPQNTWVSDDGSESTIFSKETDVDKPAQFVGGQDGMVAYFQDGFVYPEELKADEVTGKVMLEFVVYEDGSLHDVHSIKSDDERLDSPASKYVQNMPKWEPAEKDGKPVKMKMVLPIQYTMN
jgi:bla regulator protein blaR1